MAWCSIALYDVYLHAWYIGIVWSNGCERDDYNCRSDDDGHGEIVSTDGVHEKMIAIVLCVCVCVCVRPSVTNYFFRIHFKSHKNETLYNILQL